MVLSKFLDEYKTFTLRGQNNKREKLRATAKLTFEKMLYRSPTVIDIQVTDVDEVLITENTKTVMAVVNNITDNDQTSLDEKKYISLSTRMSI